MRKHLQLVALVTLLALALSPLSSFASGSCDMCGYDYDGSTCNTICGGAGFSSSSSSTESSDPGPDPIYQHASDCPCNDCVAKREGSNGDNFIEDLWGVVKSSVGPITEMAEFILKYLPPGESMDPNERIPGSTIPYLDPPHAL